MERSEYSIKNAKNILRLVPMSHLITKKIIITKYSFRRWKVVGHYGHTVFISHTNLRALLKTFLVVIRSIECCEGIVNKCSGFLCRHVKSLDIYRYTRPVLVLAFFQSFGKGIDHNLQCKGYSTVGLLYVYLIFFKIHRIWTTCAPRCQRSNWGSCWIRAKYRYR